MGRKPKEIDEDKLVELLIESGGNIAKILNVYSPAKKSAMYARIAKSENCQRAINASGQIVETELKDIALKMARNGDKDMIRLLLNLAQRRREYEQSKETEPSSGGVEFIITDGDADADKEQ